MLFSIQFWLYSLLLLILVSVVLLYFHLRRLKTNCPLLKGHPLFGILPIVSKQKDRMYDFSYECTQLFGWKTWSWRVPGLFWINILSPENIQYILKDNFDNYILGSRRTDAFKEILGNGVFNSDGDKWQRQRKLYALMFTRGNMINIMTKSLKVHCHEFLDYIQKNGPRLCIQKEIYTLTLALICEFALGYQLALDDPSLESFQESFDFVQKCATDRIIDPFWKLKRLFPTKGEMKFRHHMSNLNKFVMLIIDTRIASETQSEPSLLSELILEMKKSNRIDKKELRDFVMNILLAGRDTTASCLSWTIIRLAHHQHIQSKILEELRSVDWAKDLEPTELYNRIKQLKYLHAVIMESIRLHAPVASDCKVSLGKDELPDGTIIPPNTAVGYSPCLMGKCEKIWGADAFDFRPERWLENDTIPYELKPEPSQYAFPAFNAGPRICLGKSLALLEVKFVIAALFNQFSAHLDKDFDFHSIRYIASATLMVKDPPMITFNPVSS